MRSSNDNVGGVVVTTVGEFKGCSQGVSAHDDRRSHGRGRTSSHRIGGFWCEFKDFLSCINGCTSGGHCANHSYGGGSDGHFFTGAPSFFMASVSGAMSAMSMGCSGFGEEASHSIDQGLDGVSQNSRCRSGYWWNRGSSAGTSCG